MATKCAGAAISAHVVIHSLVASPPTATSAVVAMTRRSARFANPPAEYYAPSTTTEADDDTTNASSLVPEAAGTVLSTLITGNGAASAQVNVAANGHQRPIVLPPPTALPHPISAPSSVSRTTSATSLSPSSTTLPQPPVSPSLRALWLHAKSEASQGRAYWTEEQYVDDITVSYLYQPHTLIALGCLIGYMVYVAFTQPIDDTQSLKASLRVGASVAALFVIILGLIVFPSGPFVRPHPLLWRLAFSIGVLYEVVLILLLYQSKANARAALTFFYDDLGQPLVERPYADDCAFTFTNLWGGIADQYALSHFLGWLVKSLILRDQLLCWIISIQWELLEIGFTHWLPNFAECWWDQWLLDVLICNGLGIYAGHRLCLYLEMKEYNWRGFMTIPASDWGGRLQRAVLQFTPQSWQKVRWHKTKNLKMFFFLQLLVLAFHWEEMNAFLLKHLLWVPPPCPLNAIRLVIWAFVGVPSLRQVYTYMTDPTCKRIGTQTFLCLLMLCTELLLIVKMSGGEFDGRVMRPTVWWMWLGCGVTWVVFNVYYVGKIYRQERSVFFAEGEKHRWTQQETEQMDDKTE